jgi:DNA-binding PadR family transcriptional regulator
MGQVAGLFHLGYCGDVVDEPIRITGPFLDVIEALIEAPDELHGWGIIKATGRGGPTVYKILERMTAMGWVTARWEAQPEEPNRPRRRYYRLTGIGVTHGGALLAERRPRPPVTNLRPALGGGLR